MPTAMQGTVKLRPNALRPIFLRPVRGCAPPGAIWFRPSALLGSASLLLFLVISANAYGQQQTAELDVSSSSSLPDAPLPQFPPQNSTGQSSSAEGVASVTGVVPDSTGAAIPGAQISLTHKDGTQPRRLTSGGSGEFAFTGLPVGSYRIVVNAEGFATFTSAEFDLGSQQAYQIPNLTLAVVSTGTEVTVRPTEVIAAEQIKAEEQQRFIGIIPNFYISYVHDPAPMTTKQKFSLASHDTFDPVSLIGVGLTAGIEQANDKYPGYGYGAAGYGKRFRC